MSLTGGVNVPKILINKRYENSDITVKLTECLWSSKYWHQPSLKKLVYIHTAGWV